MTDSVTIAYFGKSTVERAIANYFAQHGHSETVRDELMIMAVKDEDNFFQMVDDFVVMNGSKV